MPRTVDVELFEDLVDTCSAGDTVTIVGLVKVINADQQQGMVGTDQAPCPSIHPGLFGTSESTVLAFLSTVGLFCNSCIAMTGWSKPKKNKGLFLIYIEANSVVNCTKGAEKEIMDGDYAPR